MNLLNRLALVVGLVLVLTSCQINPPNTAKASIPNSCEISEVINAFQGSLAGALFIPTEWQPAEGTELFEVYELGGIACTYGIESAEIGGTLMWAEVSDEFWKEKQDQWESLGYVKVDVPELDESAAYTLLTSAADDVPVWFINFRINGVWIQFGASKFISSLEDAKAILVAASSAIETTG